MSSFRIFIIKDTFLLHVSSSFQVVLSYDAHRCILGVQISKKISAQKGVCDSVTNASECVVRVCVVSLSSS